jgi:hypothetical protein
MSFNFFHSKLRFICNRLSSLTLILTLVFGLSLNIHFSQFRLSPIVTQAYTTEFQKSINIRSRSSDDFASASFQETVRKMASLGANNISLVIQFNQNGIYDTNFYTRDNTPSDLALLSGVNYIKSLGLKPSLKMFVESSDGAWRALINPSDRNAWFGNYTTLVKKYAQFSQANNLDLFNIGTEMAKMTMPEFNSDNTRQWRELIRQVRQVYSGKLTYGANHGAPFSEVDTLGFWDALDYIGISAYFTLSNNDLPSVQELVNSWQYTASQVLEPLANRYQKNIIFTEIGYRSVNKAAETPGDWSQYRYFVEDGQVNAFEALFTYFENKSYMQGMQIWDVNSDPNYGGYGNTDYTFVNKKAENTVRFWYSKQPVGQLPPISPNAKIGQAGKISIETKEKSSPILINQKPNLKIELQNRTYQSYNAIVLMQIYNSSNQPVYSDVFENQNFASGIAKTYTSNWTPNQIGNYKLRVGFFVPDWSNVVEWFETEGPNLDVSHVSSSSSSSQSSNFVSSQSSSSNNSSNSSSNSSISSSSIRASSSVASSSSPISLSLSSISSSSSSKNTLASSSASSTLSSSSSRPSSVSSSVSATNSQIEIWWPSNGSTVSGLQPFKAIVQNKPVDSYQMFWKVDEGNMNSMYSSNEGYPHKESWVDLTGWKWKGSNQTYKVTFVATQNGQIIAQKSADIIPN